MIKFPKSIRVFVSANDVKTGRRHQEDSCPLANSVKRTIKTDYRVEVCNGYVSFIKTAKEWWNDNKVVRKYKLPQNVAQMIDEYDLGGKFKVGWVEAQG